MAKLLLKLRNVPEDEYEDICSILEENEIAFYETQVGFWGIGVAAIWLRNDDQFEQAAELLNVYMQSRQQQARKAYQHAKEQGEQRTVWTTFVQQPVLFIAYLAVLLLILGLTVYPFVAI